MQLVSQQVEAAKGHGLVYIWRVEYLNGSSYEQFDKEGVERSLADDASLVCKSGDDPYFNTPAFIGVKKASWIPVVDGLNEYYVDIKLGHSLVIYRRVYYGLTPTSSEGEAYNYKVYILGSRADKEEGPIEKITYICPPVPGMILTSKGETLFFPGVATVSTDPDFVNPYEEFIRKYGSSSCQNSGLFIERGGNA